MPDIPTREEFLRAMQIFQDNERRDDMYSMATFLVDHFWGDAAKIADGLGVLLLTWNQAFYRYGSFNFDELERCIRANWNVISRFRERDIFSLSSSDEEEVIRLFASLLEALKIDSGGKQGPPCQVSQPSRGYHVFLHFLVAFTGLCD